MTFRPIIVLCLSLAVAGPAMAQTAPKHTPAKQSTKKTAPKAAPKETEKSTGSGPRLVTQYGDWGVYVATAKSKICYALAEPKDRKPAGLTRDPAYLFVSTRPGENVRNEVSVVMGFGLKDGADATLEVGNQNFSLYTKNDSAWLKNAAEEGKLIEALRKGHDVSVKGTSARGNATTDRYSLSGISQALDRVAQECK